MMSEQKEKLMDIIHDHIINTDFVENGEQIGSSRFEVELDGKKLTIEVFE